MGRSLSIPQMQSIIPTEPPLIPAKAIISLQSVMPRRPYRLTLSSSKRIIGSGTHFMYIWSRFVLIIPRHAQYSLGDFQAALSAFERGLKVDPTNASLKSGVQNAQARIIPNDDEGPPPFVADDGPHPSSNTRAPAGGGATGLGGMGGMADMFRGMGGLGGGGGGMPDLASIMNNPQMMAMAQQMAANGGLASLLQNPSVADMMSRVQQGDMPSMDEIMADPSLRDLANQFGAGGR
ncbi:hypothetical protein BDZ94DRAFT_110746 [Collybia nuda]|uniref:Uncharacterized protein n=1 Tax=Collybia nuda TaxID=64659 RepID=A0A9P5XZ57_9AGAR|nr:hypothetical protein BDZ94DRAFT_110746 [Collybia nuda]